MFNSEGLNYDGPLEKMILLSYYSYDSSNLSVNIARYPVNLYIEFIVVFDRPSIA